MKSGYPRFSTPGELLREFPQKERKQKDDLAKWEKKLAFIEKTIQKETIQPTAPNSIQSAYEGELTFNLLFGGEFSLQWKLWRLDMDTTFTFKDTDGTKQDTPWYFPTFLAEVKNPKQEKKIKKFLFKYEEAIRTTLITYCNENYQTRIKTINNQITPQTSYRRNRFTNYLETLSSNIKTTFTKFSNH